MESNKQKTLVTIAVVSSLFLAGCASNDELIEQQNQQADQISTLQAQLDNQKVETDNLSDQVERLTAMQGKIVNDIQTKESIYTIKQHDTLYKVANTHGMTVDELLNLNPDIKNPNALLIGQQVRLK